MSVEDNIKLIREVIEEPVTLDDFAGIMEHLDKLIKISALSAQTVARAKYLWQSAQEAVLCAYMDKLERRELKGMPVSLINERIKTKTAEQEETYVLADRLDKRISYAIDARRSHISALKKEMETQQWQQT